MGKREKYFCYFISRYFVYTWNCPIVVFLAENIQMRELKHRNRKQHSGIQKGRDYVLKAPFSLSRRFENLREIIKFFLSAAPTMKLEKFHVYPV